MSKPLNLQAQKRLVPLLCFTVFFSVLNGSMFNVALPVIGSLFHLSKAELSWVVTGFIIFFAIGSVTYGKLADLFPVRNLITTGLIIFNIGSLIGTFSQWYWMLIAARLIQAAGASAIPALSMIIATRYIPPQQRGKVLGATASTVAFGSGVGPIIGGLITGYLHWRYLFVITVFTLLAIPLFRKWLPQEEPREESFDILGAFLMGTGVASLLLFITEMEWWLLALAVFLIGLLNVHILRAQNPFIQPKLFKNKHYRLGLLVGFMTVGTFFATMFMIPLLLQQVNRLDPEHIGLVMFPGAMTAAFTGTMGGRLADRKGSVPVVLAGILLLISGFLGMSSLAGSVPWMIAAVMVICYIGFSFIQSSLAKTVSMTLEQRETGVGMGLYNMTFFMGGAFGSSIAGKLLDILPDHLMLNPLNHNPTAAAYSNLFFLFILIDVLAVLLFFRTFRGEALREAGNV